MCGDGKEAHLKVLVEQPGSPGLVHVMPRCVAFPASCCIFCCSCCCCRRFEEATHRTTRWIDRCVAAHSRPHEQNLFAIVQVRDCWVGAVLEAARSVPVYRGCFRARGASQLQATVTPLRLDKQLVLGHSWAPAAGWAG
jgi:hypothetical protein